METSASLGIVAARSVFFLEDGVEGHNEAHVKDPNEGGAHHDQDCEQEDPNLRIGSREVNTTNEHSKLTQNVQEVLEEDESCDVFRVPGLDAMNLQGRYDN